MIDEIPGTEEYLYELAVLYIYDKKPLEAIRIYDEIETLYGVNETSSLQKRMLYAELGKMDQAIAESEKLIEVFPDEEQFVLAFAEFLSQQNQRDRAIQLLNDYLKTHGESGSTKMLLAGIYRDNGQEKEARALIIKTIEDPSVEVGSKVLMVAIYLNQFTEQKEQTENEGLRQFLVLTTDKLIEQYPADPNVFLVAGDLMLALSNEPEACTNYQRAIQNGSTSFDAWQNLLVIESKLNFIDSLLKHSESCLELFPNQGIVYYFNGYANFRKKRYKESASALEQAKKLSASNPQTIFEINSLLGDVYNASKEYSKSDKAYDEALAYKPNDEVILNNYSYYLALRKENLERAEKMSEQLVKNRPDNPSYLDTHAWVLFMREKYKEARKIIEKAISAGGTSAIFYEHYGDILFKLGEVDEAVVQWKQSKNLDAKNEHIDKKIANRNIN
ncbi:MAG: tetratricopeptide repeat protein [Flammeovirgaceae bacterium]|nr:tetratricopeptide repeat protein [Flammeovirgaceae bacterium]